MHDSRCQGHLFNINYKFFININGSYGRYERNGCNERYGKSEFKYSLDMIYMVHI